MRDKDYIKDDGRIRDCQSNIAKMTILEYVLFKITDVEYLKRIMVDISEQYYEGLKNLGAGIINTLLFIFLPITLLTVGYTNIKDARKEVENHQRMVDAVGK